MRVLLDEDVPHPLRLEFPAGYDVETVAHRGWKGLKNGELLRNAERDFDVLLTLDGNLPQQQDIKRFKLAVIVLRAASNRLSDLRPLLPQLRDALTRVRPGEAIVLGPL